MKVRFWMQIIAIGALTAILTLPAVAQAPLLSSSQSGAFGVRYLTNRAVVTYTVERPEDTDADTFTLRVRLPEKVQWGFLGREAIADEELRYSDSQAVVDVPFGSHRVHLGWAGEACLPPESADIPVFLDDEQVATLRARFDLEGMHAGGEVPGVGPGLATPRLELARILHPDDVSLSLGSEVVTDWDRGDDVLEAREPGYIDQSPRLSLRVQRRNLRGSPIDRVVISDVKEPSPTERVEDDQVPEGVLVEAEDFTNATGTPPRVEPGSHHDTHGGACVFSFLGNGSSLEWEVEIPEDGRWDLYARISCGDVGAWRIVEVDGEKPEGLSLVELPGTGGWGHADGEWWVMRLTGTDELAPSLQLEAGKHTIGMTGVLTTHLNIDYLLLVPKD